MRRVPKPFTVEIRSSSRKLKTKAASERSWPQLDEQPDVVRPDTPVEPVMEPYRDPRKPPPIRTVQAEDRSVAALRRAETETPAAKPAGHILPVIIEEPVAIAAQPLGENANPLKPAKRAKQPKAVLPAEPIVDKPVAYSPPAINTRAIAATIVLRQGKDRLTRDDFKRGQRWKARLPASVHRAKSRDH